MEKNEIGIRRRVIGEYLLKRRTEQSLTQHQVAQQLGYTSPQFISNWERGMASPPFNVLPKLVEIYKIPPEDMINVLMKYQAEIMEEHRKTLFAALKKRSSGRNSK